MKVLSIKQPWATLIALGLKNREHRSWDTKFRGRFLIHASKQADLSFMSIYGFNINAFPLGVVVAEANLYDTKRYETGTVAFLLDEIQQITPFPLMGQLGFFEYKK